MNEESIWPNSGALEYASGQADTLVSADVERFFLSCSAAAQKRWREEGGEAHAKPLARLGGSSEFERAVQLSIIRKLQSEWRKSLPVVMIIGDSIRMRTLDGTGYWRHAYRRLLGSVNIIHVPHNCGGTRGVEQWISNWMEAKPDIVTLNAGLHDLALPQGDSTQTGMFREVDEYARALIRIFRIISQSGVNKLFWCLNTPVHEERHKFVPGSSRLRTTIRFNRDVDRYNDASAQVAKDMGVEVVDLNTPLREVGPGDALLPDGLHLNGLGARVLGDILAKKVLNFCEY